MKSLQIYGFKADAPYTTVYFRSTTSNRLIGYFSWGPLEKFHRLFMVVMM